MSKVVKLRRTPADVLDELRAKADKIESFVFVVIQKDDETYAQWSADLGDLAIAAACLNKAVASEL
jgi:hypothetical protein